MAIDVKLFNEENPNFAFVYNNLGNAWMKKNEPDKAKAYNIYYNTYGAEHHYTKDLKNKIAYLENEQDIDTKVTSS